MFSPRVRAGQLVYRFGYAIMVTVLQSSQLGLPAGGSPFVLGTPLSVRKRECMFRWGSEEFLRPRAGRHVTP